MDESWKMRMGMPSITATKSSLSRRRSTEEISNRRPTLPGDSVKILLDPDDFNDVFGGPPRAVFSRQFSAGAEFPRSSSSSSFYEEVFRPAEAAALSTRRGRNLPEFKIPASGVGRKNDRQGFYSDIFGWDDLELGRRSRTRSGSKSKNSSASVLSSEELSPFRPAIGGDGDDDDVSFFASKLRPINVPSRWTSAAQIYEDQSIEQGMPAVSSNRPPYIIEHGYEEDLKGSHYGFCPRATSPETICLAPNSSCRFKMSADDIELNSPSSVVSSLCQDQEANPLNHRGEVVQEQIMVDCEDDEMMSSYIEINPECEKSRDEAIGVDEAIAWAKEKFQTLGESNCMKTQQEEKSINVKELANENQFSNGDTDGLGHQLTAKQADEEPDKCVTTEEKQLLITDREMQFLDKKIRVWATGKELDIRLLLSTLHHVVWPNSGWLAIPLKNLIDSSNIKKAYQKARLCLHPDKLQQRGATAQQKYIAEKAFSILQDAWAASLSQDIYFG